MLIAPVDVKVRTQWENLMNFIRISTKSGWYRMGKMSTDIFRFYYQYFWIYIYLSIFLDLDPIYKYNVESWKNVEICQKLWYSSLKLKIAYQNLPSVFFHSPVYYRPGLRTAENEHNKWLWWNPSSAIIEFLLSYYSLGSLVASLHTTKYLVFT